MAEVKSSDVAVFKEEISQLEKQASSMAIETKDDYIKGVEISSQLKEFGSKIKDKKESITKPLNEALKNVRNIFKPIEDSFENAKKIVNSKLLVYSQKAREEAEAKEAKIAQDLESGKIKKLETAEKKMDQIERVENTTKGEAGGVQLRIIKKVRITDKNLLPMEYLKPDEVAIRRDALGGKVIPGVEVYDEEVLANIQ